jgi:hypothetical protein
MQDRTSITIKPKRKRVSNEKDLQKKLDKLRIELGNNKSQQKLLENQLLNVENVLTKSQ